jgi:hypothetical protein
MSPTVLRVRGYRFYFYSSEETRPHIHVRYAGGKAKFWLTPNVALSGRSTLRKPQRRTARRLIEEHRDEFVEKFNRFMAR